jgi:hypothetical protein
LSGFDDGAMLSVAPVGKPSEVEFLQAVKIRAGRLVCDTFELHGALIQIYHPADD